MNLQSVREVTAYLTCSFSHFFTSVCVFCDLATLCGNEHVTKPRRTITSFLIVALCMATLTVANTSNYSSEERLVASVGVSEDSECWGE